MKELSLSGENITTVPLCRIFKYTPMKYLYTRSKIGVNVTEDQRLPSFAFVSVPHIVERQIF